MNMVVLRIILPLILIWYNVVSEASNPPTVMLTTGPIVGRALNNSFLAFQGVPFARKPIGSLRFMEPLDPEKWSDPLNTTKYSEWCTQSINNWFGSEDCLYINVFTKNVNASNLKPVFVWIHGGAFKKGSGNRFPEMSIYNQFVSKGIVFVSFNYRLNLFGFLTTETSEIPANIGMLDQVFALQWIQREISKFGGDPSRVTIGGESAGSASVSYHLRSPLSQGFFNQAIMESGTCLNFWALTMSSKNLKLENSAPYYFSQQPPSEFVITSLKCTTSLQWNNKNYTGIRKCLQALSLKDIMTVLPSLSTPVGLIQWSPMVSPPFLPQHPSTISVNKSINILMGSNRDEWPFDALNIRKDPSLLNLYTSTTFEMLVEYLAGYHNYQENYKLVEYLLRYEYSPEFEASSKPVSHNDWFWAQQQMTGDFIINNGVVAEARNLNKNGNQVFLYSFDFASPGFWGSSPVTVVTHFMDVIYLFPGVTHSNKFAGYTFDVIDRRISRMMASYWSNFVIDGIAHDTSDQSLNIGWPTMGVNDTFLSITQLPTVQLQFRAKTNSFWNLLLLRILNDTIKVSICP